MPEPWATTQERDSAANSAVVYSCIFGFLAFMLACSIGQTIRTSPGHIPEDKEWDMLTDSLAESSSSEESGGFSSSEGASGAGSDRRNVE